MSRSLALISGNATNGDDGNVSSNIDYVVSSVRGCVSVWRWWRWWMCDNNRQMVVED